MNRREFIGGAAAFCAAHSDALQIGRRVGALSCGGGGGWTNPYVADGLIAMWDGEWNAGPGVHDPSTIVWADIVGGHSLDISPNAMFDDNGISVRENPCNYLACGDYDLTFSHCEIVTSGCSMSRFLICTKNESSAYGQGIFMSSDFIDFGRGNDTANVCDSHFSRYETFSISASFNGRTLIDAYINSIQAIPSRRAYNNFGKDKFYIGGDGTYYGATDSKLFTVRLYSAHLTAEQVAANYAVDHARFGV